MTAMSSASPGPLGTKNRPFPFTPSMPSLLEVATRKGLELFKYNAAEMAFKVASGERFPAKHYRAQIFQLQRMERA